VCVATFTAITAAGKSLERLLNACFAVDKPHPGKTVRAALVQTDDFVLTDGASKIAQRSPVLSIFLYRVEVDAITRAGWSGVGSIDGRSHLPLDLHYLLTAWDDSAEFEHQILGSAMSCLDTTPILTGPLLHPATTWEPNEGVQVMFEDLGTDQLMRIYDSLEANFRTSIPYRVRVVRVESSLADPPPTVTDVYVGKTVVVGDS